MKCNELNFTEWQDANWEKDNMFPPPMDAQVAFNYVTDYLLGEDYYIVNPLSTAQANVEILHDILYKYSRQYRKEYRKRWKNKKG